MSFQKTFEVRWADLDANRHVRHTVYNDYATHVRFSYLASQGFDERAFRERDIGPVLLREETRFHREVMGGDTLTIDIRLAGLSPDGGRFTIAHDVVRSDDIKAATVVVDGGWLELVSRKLVRPPPDLHDVLQRMTRSEGFQSLSSLGWGD